MFSRVRPMLLAQRMNIFLNARLASMLQQKLRQSLAGERKQSPENKIDGSGRAFDVQQDRMDRVFAGRRCHC